MVLYGTSRIASSITTLSAPLAIVLLNSWPEFRSADPRVQQDHDYTAVHAVRILSVCADCTQATPRRSRHEALTWTLFCPRRCRSPSPTNNAGYTFYSRALEATRDEATREVFARLVEEEKRHLAALQKEFEALHKAHPSLDDEPSMLYFDYDRLEDIFPQSQPNVVQTVQSFSPAEARIAMAAERRSYEFLAIMLTKLSTPKDGLFSKKFAHEEQRHLTMIRHAHDAPDKA